MVSGSGWSEEPIGALLTRLRRDQGKSQLHLAELLCAQSGQATVTRHEVSRWERGVRIPHGYWLRWLAVALDVPLDTLRVAAFRARRLGYQSSHGVTGRAAAHTRVNAAR
jgi:transcriptional regulator with XRE-family HTH domain